LLRGARLFEARAFFEAHEAWEERWHIEENEERRRFLQGLIQVAAGFHKAVDAGAVSSAERLLGRGMDKLDACPNLVTDRCLVAFCDGVRACQRALALGTFDRGKIPVLALEKTQEQGP
jgi:hypothetical protein